MNWLILVRRKRRRRGRGRRANCDSLDGRSRSTNKALWHIVLLSPGTAYSFCHSSRIVCCAPSDFEATMIVVSKQAWPGGREGTGWKVRTGWKKGALEQLVRDLKNRATKLNHYKPVQSGPLAVKRAMSGSTQIMSIFSCTTVRVSSTSISIKFLSVASKEDEGRQGSGLH